MAIRADRPVAYTTVEETSDIVAATSTEYLEMQTLGEWQLIRDLWGGTRTMRNARELWLPRNEKELDVNYNARIARSFLFNGLKDTLEETVAKPLSKDIVVEGIIDSTSLPEQIINLHLDVDRSGTSLQEFTKDSFLDGLQYGVTHALIDFPEMPMGLTLEEENSLKPQPIWVNVSPPNLIGWRFDGNKELDQIRLIETRIIPVTGSVYLDERIKFIRVVNKHTWELWKEVTDEKGNKKFELLLGGVNSLGKVPLKTFYTSKLGELTGVSPFLSLAWLNLAHWQSNSEQRNILRIARVVNIMMKGLTEDEMAKPTVIGPDSTHRFMNENADMKFVEHSGKAIEAGAKDLKNLEEQMETMGLKVVSSTRTGSVTATEVSQKSSKTSSLIQQWIRDLENYIEGCYGLSADWMKATLPDDFKVEIFDDFTITIKANDDMDRIIKMREQKDIDQETELKEAKRRGLLSDDVIVNDVIANTDSEKEKNLADFGRSQEDLDDNDEDEDEDENTNSDNE